MCILLSSQKGSPETISGSAQLRPHPGRCGPVQRTRRSASASLLLWKPLHFHKPFCVKADAPGRWRPSSSSFGEEDWPLPRKSFSRFGPWGFRALGVLRARGLWIRGLPSGCDDLYPSRAGVAVSVALEVLSSTP